MKMKLPTLTGLGLVLFMTAGAMPLRGQEAPEVCLGVDLVSRYIWRGINVGDAPSVQPSLSLEVRGFEIGAWGAYSLSNKDLPRGTRSTSGSDTVSSFRGVEKPGWS